jgi:stage II sporulation protein D
MKLFLPVAVSCMTALSVLSIPLRAHELPSDVSQKAKPATIKILLENGVDSALLEVKGRYQICNLDNDLQIASGVLSKRSKLIPHEEGIKWKETFPGIFQMRIVPLDSKTSILVNGIQYRGCVEVYQIQGKLHIVNEIDVENYLKSTLTTQFPQVVDKDVMDAIAIVARTNAYHFILRNAHVFWHADAIDVGYQGYGITLQNLHVDRAVETTRYQVLTYKNTPFAATWTQDSAGITASFPKIFRKDVVAPEGVQLPVIAKERDKHSWSFTLRKEELAKIIKAPAITGIDLFQDSHSGKVYAVRIKEGSHSQDIDFFSLQKALGKHKLRSNDFSIALKADTITFTGFGVGHGVGLCLHSATQMARQGEKTQKILTTFFPDTQLENRRTSIR